MGLNYPHYTNSGRMIAPFVELTLGSILNNTPGFFNNINVDYDDSIPWEILGVEENDNIQLPFGVNVNLSFTVIGDRIPGAESLHIYGLPTK